MSITELRTKIGNNWPTDFATNLGITATNGGTIDGWVNDMQRRICRTYNFQFMKQEVYHNTTDEEQRYALPAGGPDEIWTEILEEDVRKFKTEISCWLKNAQNYRNQLTRRYKTSIEEDWKFDNTAGYGIPSCYYVDANYLMLFKKPKHSYNNNTAFVMYLNFYGYLADLSDANTTNYITQNYPDILEYGATALGYNFADDDARADKWMDKAKEVFDEMVRADKLAEHAGIEEGIRPAFGQSLAPQGRPSLIMWQGTDWYNG